MLNVYGPTEATVNTTAKACRPGEAVTIGRPLDGYVALILDAEMNPLPPGEMGELYIGGAGIARGYLNQPELTERHFITAAALWPALPHRRPRRAQRRRAKSNFSGGSTIR